MKTLIYIFIGGGAGSVLRYLVSGYTQKLWNLNGFPAGTLLVNVLGCFLLAFISYRFITLSSEMKLLMSAGFCGGFTTFSTFSAENFRLYETGNSGLLLLNIVLSIVLGILAFWAGMKFATVF